MTSREQLQVATKIIHSTIYSDDDRVIVYP
jgi:hypothetical protein